MKTWRQEKILEQARLDNQIIYVGQDYFTSEVRQRRHETLPCHIASKICDLPIFSFVLKVSLPNQARAYP